MLKTVQQNPSWQLSLAQLSPSLFKSFCHLVPLYGHMDMNMVIHTVILSYCQFKTLPLCHYLFCSIRGPELGEISGLYYESFWRSGYQLEFCHLLLTAYWYLSAKIVCQSVFEVKEELVCQYLDGFNVVFQMLTMSAKSLTSRDLLLTLPFVPIHVYQSGCMIFEIESNNNFKILCYMS